MNARAESTLESLAKPTGGLAGRWGAVCAAEWAAGVRVGQTGGMSSVEIVAHRGWSGRNPEMTLAAYQDAIGLAARTGRKLSLECDAQFSADGQLVLLHDHTLERIAGVRQPAYELTMAQLRGIDVGSWKTESPTPNQRRLITLEELFNLVEQARVAGHEVECVVETKHPNPRGLDVDRACLDLVRAYGWGGADSPVRMISFNPEAVELYVTEAPLLRRSLLIEKTLGPWANGVLPDGVDTVGIDHRLAANHPEFVEGLFSRGHHLHLWTVNDAAQMTEWIRAGASGITTDHPDVALETISG